VVPLGRLNTSNFSNLISLFAVRMQETKVARPSKVIGPHMLYHKAQKKSLRLFDGDDIWQSPPIGRA